MNDGGKRSRKHVPERTCLVTRRIMPRAGMLRFVLSPDGEVVFDLKGNLPGRGAWLAPDRRVLEEAIARNAFSRAFKARARAPEDLAERVRGQIGEAALSVLSLARKAGEAVSGFDKVAALIEKGAVAVLIEAADGAGDGRRKLEGKLKKAGKEAKVIDSFDSAQLSLAFSRPNVIHAAMKHGALAEKFVILAERAKALRPLDGA